MKSLTFLIMGALVLGCAHRSAQREVAAAPAPASAKSQALSEAPQAPPDDGHSGDPSLGNLQLANAPAAPRAEVANDSSDASKSAAPRVIEPAAPTVATAPPGSALTPPLPAAASKEEAELRERIQRTLLQHRNLSFTARRVRVEIERGRVTLLGEVRTTREKSEVEDLVQKVSGVRRVTNQLAIIDQPASAKAP
jgi:hypothetical protein